MGRGLGREARAARVGGWGHHFWFTVGVVLSLVLLLPVGVARAGVLVLAPHPDDDIISSAGVVSRSVGVDEVTVVFMTNGDINGRASGLLRQAEAVAAQTGYLGTIEDNLIFLGYPDGRLAEIFANYTSLASQYVTPFGQGVTYGNRGLGQMDYHSYRFGAPAAYNLPNMVQDLSTVLATYRPAHIYTTSEFDQHSDHSTTYRVLRLALDQVRSSDPTYAPVIHKTIIWSTNSSAWPTPVDPVTYHTETPGLTGTPLRWDERESLDVPLAMQDLNLRVNPKYRAIQSHASQAGTQSFIGRFARKDEIFWSENPFGSNRPPVADAGTDIVAQAGQFVLLDGSASRDPEGSPLQYQWTSRSGAPVTVIGGDTAYPGFTIPAGATASDTWTFQLSVSDGALASAPDMVTVYGGTPEQNVAPQAVATASSEDATFGQQARKAIDRLVEGYPIDDTFEWATVGQRDGAWVRLTWPAPVNVYAVELFDRPNADDRVTGGTLTFSDGSSLAVPALNNDGRAGTRLAFAPRNVTSVTFTVTSVSSATVNIGLAEMRVFGGSAAPSDMTAPSVPGSLTVDGTTATTVSLGWSASTDTGGSGLAGYRIYRNGGLTPLASVPGTSYTDSGLTPGTSYSYRASAYDGAGNESALAGPVNGTTQNANVAPVVTNPGSQSGTVGTAITALQIVATDGNGDALSYSATGLPAGLTINASSGLITGTPSAAGTSSVTVTVSDGRGGTDSATFSWTIGDQTPPTVPTGLTVTGTTTTSISLSWSASTDAGGSGLVGYRIYRDGGAAALTSVTGTTITDTGLVANSSHTYRVTAYDAAGNESAAAGPITGTARDISAPSVPQNLAVTGTTTTSISLSWSASTDTGGSGRAGYRIYRNGSTTPLASVTGRTFTDSGLVTGTTNSYRVSAYDVAGNESAPAGTVTGTALDVQAPTVPQNLRSSNVTSSSMTLTWSASTDAGGSGLAGYRVFRDGTHVATVTTTSFTDTGLRSNTRYRYRVAAIDNSGNQSSQSSQLSVTTLR